MRRRTFLRGTAALPFGLGLGPSRLWAATVPSYAEQHPDMLEAHLAERLKQLDAGWDRKRGAIQTAEDLAARNAFIRQRLTEMLGGFPERTPLNPVTAGALERDGYRIDKLSFESRPDFRVTANLYVPDGQGPFPGIIAPGGRHSLGRLDPGHQLACLNLARAGFVVLAFDLIGQGERRYYWDPRKGKSELADVELERVLPGGLLLLIAEHLAQHHVWDGMRAIDYLLTRPEVDRERIGCTGHSLGGLVTLLVSVLDERVGCAVVNEGGTFHRWPAEIGAGVPEEIERVLIPAAAHGMDLPDLHAAIAPRPLLALAEHNSPAFEAAVQQIREAYEHVGAAERFGSGEAADPHGWTVKLRLATTDWFSRWFYNRTVPTMEPDLVPEAAESLYATPIGSLRHSRRGHTIFSLILDQQASLPPARKVPSNLSEFESFRRDIDTQVRKLLPYSAVSAVSDRDWDVRHLMTTPRKRYRIVKQEFLSEPGVYVPAWTFIPEGGDGPFPATLFVSGEGLEAHGMEFGPLERLAQQGHYVVAVDVRGVGQTAPERQGRARGRSPYGHLFDCETALTYMAWSMGESLLGMRVRDLVRSLAFVLQSDDVERSGIRVIGHGRGAVWALFAAALDRRVRGLVADRGLLSYQSLMRADRHRHGMDVLIPGVLQQFDLPQVAAAIADRHLVILDPLDPAKRPADIRVARQTYEWTRLTYSNLGVEDRFQLVARQPGSDPADAYLSFLGKWLGA